MTAKPAPATLPTVTVAEMQPGNRVNAYLMVREAKLEAFKNKPGQFLTITFADRTGTIAGKVWENVAEAQPIFQPGYIVKVQGDVGEYRGGLDFTVQKFRVAEANEYAIADFLPATAKDIDGLLAELDAGLRRISNPSLYALVQWFLFDDGFRALLSTAPCSENFNHPVIGGLLEHTAEMLTLAETMIGLYPMVNADLVRAGVLLCNIGKTRSYTTAPFIGETEAHKAQGHILLGYEMVIRAIVALEARAKTDEVLQHFVPADLEGLKHIMAAQSGRLEWGSPTWPKTLEAEIVHGCEYLSARASAALNKK